MALAVGIDLGTTNSVLAVLQAGEPEVISSAEGGRTTPSVVAFTADGVPLVGEQAKRQAVTNPDRTFRSVKRHMGSAWSCEVDGVVRRPQEVLAMVLAKLKADAEAFLEEEISDTVITVPAYYTDSQRQATKDAGEIAGLNVVRIINEPTAAAVAYGLDQAGSGRILVFDLGGGTFDVSALQVSKDSDGSTVQVVATAGDNHLGGDDWDGLLVDWLVEKFHTEHGIDLAGDPAALVRVREAAEDAKVQLSIAPSAQIHVPFLAASATGDPLHLSESVSQAHFEELTRHLVDMCKEPFAQVLADARWEPSSIDHVLLVGGSTRMPAIARLICDLTGKDPSRSVNPDEAVAVGAALQAGVLSGQRSDLLLIDVAPLTLGIETVGGVMNPVVARNTAIPVRMSKTFTTSADAQSAVKIRVFQGERAMVEDNKLLGNFNLTGIPAAPAGTPQIEVTFDIDADAMVHVHARDLSTGLEQRMTVSGAGGIGAEEKDRMIAEAKRNRENDEARRDWALSANTAERSVYQALRVQGARPPLLNERDAEALSSHLAATRRALQVENPGVPDLERLQDCVMELGLFLAGVEQPRDADANPFAE